LFAQSMAAFETEQLDPSLTASVTIPLGPP
jgi:hypothetical protein